MSILDQQNIETSSHPQMGGMFNVKRLINRRIGRVAGSVPPGYTLLYDSSSAGGSTVNSSNGNLTYYAGHTLFNIGGTPLSNPIGKVTFRLTSVGTLAGKTYVVKFWSSNGSQDCVTQQTVSDDIAGASWTDVEVEAVFSTPWNPATSTDYNITIAEKSGTADASNYITVHYIVTASSPGTPAPGNLGYSWWGPNSGVPGAFGTVNNTTSIACMKIYTVS